MFTPYRTKTLSDVKETYSIEVFNDVIQNFMLMRDLSSSMESFWTCTVFPVSPHFPSRGSRFVSKNCDESSRNFLVEFILEKKA